MEDTVCGRIDGEERGKRRAANRILFLWAIITLGSFGSIVGLDLDQAQRDALILLYRTLTFFSGTTSLLLYGLDTTGVQIMPTIMGNK